MLTLVGLDFGSTTSSAVVASAALVTCAATGRRELAHITTTHQSRPIFTPFIDGRLDIAALTAHVDGWLDAAQVDRRQLFGGGALVTGLAARVDNAADVARLVESRLGEALVATADDPCLESWLAFMANVGRLSRNHPERAYLNIDIGGGTANFAYGRAGAVLRTGCVFVGARHLRFAVGTRRLEAHSPFGRTVLRHLEIDKAVGDVLDETEVERIATFYADFLVNHANGNASLAPLVQVPFVPPRSVGDLVVTVSGGVGELVYQLQAGAASRVIAPFGDLGLDLALALTRGPWARHFAATVPEARGHATAFGLLKHATQVSGATLYLPDPSLLPLPNVPIVGRIAVEACDDEVLRTLQLAVSAPRCGGVWIEGAEGDPDRIAHVGRKIAAALVRLAPPSNRVIVLFLAANAGKTLGNYATNFGRLRVALVVVDEVEDRGAQYVRIGSPRDHVVPVSLFGLNHGG